MSRLARTSRQWLTARLVDGAAAVAPLLPAWAITAAEQCIARVGPHAPLLGSAVAANLRAAGVDSPAARRAYFARAAGHLAAAVQVFRHAREPAEPGRMPAGLAAFVNQRIHLDASFERLRQAAASGRGVVLMGVHASGFLLVLARMNQELPITVYLRHSRDARKLALKRRWCEITGLSYIAEPPSAANPARRAEIMADALHAGRTLIITPDLAQKREDGVPVRLFGREVYLPGGPAALSILVDAPLVTVLAAPAGADPRAITLRFFGPFEAAPPPRVRGWRQAAIGQRLQWFADLMTAEFLLRHPELWFLWGDKRWTRVFRDDPRYTRALADGPALTGVPAARE